MAVSEVESYLRMAGIEEAGTKLKYLRLVQRLDEVELKLLNRKA